MLFSLNDKTKVNDENPQTCYVADPSLNFKRLKEFRNSFFSTKTPDFGPEFFYVAPDPGCKFTRINADLDPLH